jgi:hypothetical protein
MENSQNGPTGRSLAAADRFEIDQKNAVTAQLVSDRQPRKTAPSDYYVIIEQGYFSE